ncbi:MAG: glycosyltransferase family A protein [Chloroflexi bacterium]|nr:glycosyltransferase family A protein [Chloroflexota bacterium]
MKTKSLISVVIPVYNGERYLGQAIASVLAQAHRPIEIIVVDDGSTDGSAKLSQQFGPPVRYHYQPNAGLGATRNLGVTLAQGEFLAFLDADDLWVPNKLDLQLCALMDDPSLDISFGHVSQFHSPELDEETRRRIVLPDAPLVGCHPGTMLIRQTTFRRIGRFRADPQVGQFIDWYARAQEQKLKMQVLPQVLMLRRLHGTNMSLEKRAARSDYARLLGDVIRRRRQKDSDG